LGKLTKLLTNRNEKDESLFSPPYLWATSSRQFPFVHGIDYPTPATIADADLVQAQRLTALRPDAKCGQKNNKIANNITCTDQKPRQGPPLPNRKSIG
jgi:hypothetical protein